MLPIFRGWGKAKCRSARRCAASDRSPCDLMDEPASEHTSEVFKTSEVFIFIAPYHF